MKTIISLILTAITILSCSDPGSKKMIDQTTMGNANKQDSTSGYANVNGLKMYYEIHGKGTVLVLIHGGGSTIQTTFGRVLPLLVKDHKVIAVEMQAHGQAYG